MSVDGLTLSRNHLRIAREDSTRRGRKDQVVFHVQLAKQHEAVPVTRDYLYRD